MKESWIPLFIDWAIPAMLVLVAVYVLSIPLLERIKRRQYRQMLKQLSAECMHDVVLESDFDEFTHIDHLLLLPDGIYVLQPMNFSGTIFAGDSIDLWTQVLGQRSYKFPNPLHQVENIVGTIKSLAETNNVVSWLVFSDECRFPKGKPARVSTLSALQQDLLAHCNGEIPAKLRESWEKLVNVVQVGSEGETRHASGTAADTNTGRMKWGILLLFLAAAWVLWRKAGLM